MQDPGQLLRIAGVLEVEAAPLAAVERVGHARGARDDRAVAGIHDPRRGLAVDHLAGVDREREQVAVAAEARAQAAAQPREGAAVAQQQVGGAQRAGAEHEVVAGDRVQRRRAAVVLGRRDVVERGVVDGVAAALARLEAAHVAQRAQLGAVVGGVREVVVVERVLGAVVAAHVALAAQLARRAGAPVEVLELLDDRLAGHRRAPLVGEGDRELGQEPLQAVGLGGGLEGDRLRRLGVRLVVEGIALQADHRLDAVVVGVEIGARDRPVLVAAVAQVLLHEPLLVLADEDVGVDERAAAEPRRHERVDPVEGPVVVHAGQAVGRVPEALAGAVRAARERARRVGAAALQDADRLAGLRQAVRRHRAAEARADDDCVVVAVLAVHAHRAEP